ncbi:hypothetical protein [Lonepinella sp. BR2930]|uniref:hypothetical protein n=1 Tax=Lonepinella sp. BR2930 TaxID=3434554 RepID=UPI003F6DF84A
MNDINTLKSNITDKTTLLLKGALGAIPYIGSLLSEITNIIPNQRIDRIVAYIQKLSEKLDAIEIDIVNICENADSPYLILIEDSFIQASRVITSDRREYIASLIVNGLTDDETNIERHRYLLRLLSELNDEEIIWLRFYLKPYFGGDEEFRKRHENVLTLARHYINAPVEQQNLASLQDSYKVHLERLGLLKKRIKVDSKTRIPIFDRMTGEPEGTVYITHLGKMLLKEIGFIDKDDE